MICEQGPSWHQAPLKRLVDLMPEIGGSADTDLRWEEQEEGAALDPTRTSVRRRIGPRPEVPCSATTSAASEGWS
jgi:hypothetical protein